MEQVSSSVMKEGRVRDNRSRWTLDIGAGREMGLSTKMEFDVYALPLPPSPLLSLSFVRFRSSTGVRDSCKQFSETQICSREMRNAKFQC